MSGIKIILLAAVYGYALCWANVASIPGASEDERFRQRNIQDVIAACRGFQLNYLQNKYQETRICQFITELEQIGADAIELIKAWVPLGPFEYFLFTLVNFNVSGRLRAQLKPLIHPKVTNVVEYRREGEVWIILSYQWF